MSTKKSFKDWISGEMPVLVDFHASWCGPCQMLAPVISELAGEMNGQLKILKVDIDKNQQFSRKLNVKGVPTLMLYKNGEVVWRKSGFMTGEQIKQSIQGFV